MFCFVLLAWFCGFLRALYCIIWILVEFPLYPAQHIPASQDWLQGKTQVNDNVFGLVSTAHSSTKPGIIRAMAWVSYSHENGVGWVQSTWFFFLCAWKPYRLEVPGAPRVDECVFQYLTQCLSAAAADHAGDDAVGEFVSQQCWNLTRVWFYNNIKPCPVPQLSHRIETRQSVRGWIANSRITSSKMYIWWYAMICLTFWQNNGWGFLKWSMLPTTSGIMIPNDRDFFLHA